ncbi:hypothetical protein F4861DRAFT_187284 [Xylaria intraflava]|nr:hypothetical protein F4861DRAFT_187284 [Xylaria intraflava]
MIFLCVFLLPFSTITSPILSLATLSCSQPLTMLVSTTFDAPHAGPSRMWRFVSRNSRNSRNPAIATNPAPFLVHLW